MQPTFGLDIPRSLEDVCRPERMALVVYDMQVGIVSQIPTGAEITARVAQVLGAARKGGFRVFFTRHMSLKTWQGYFAAQPRLLAPAGSAAASSRATS